MGFYINRNGDYYEGDRQGADKEVPQRPSAPYTYNGSVWVPEPQEQLDQLFNDAVVQQIIVLEASQARAVREAALGSLDRLKVLDEEITRLRLSLKPVKAPDVL